MPLKVFEKLTEYLHVADRESEPPRGSDEFDRLFKIRPVLNVIAKNFAQYYKPSRDQAIDEGMIAFTGHLSYVQYMPAKPIKRGIKLWLRCDSNSAYLHQFDVYLGRSGNRTDSTNGLYFDVVDKLTESLHGGNHHVYFDNLYTSVPLLKYLLTKKVYACGTVCRNRRHLPREIKAPGKLVRVLGCKTAQHQIFVQQFGITKRMYELLAQCLIHGQLKQQFEEFMVRALM